MLIISNNPWSFTQNNGKTLESFIKGWDRDSVAQLYFRDETPSSDVCMNFYRITDRDMLNQCLGKTRIIDDTEDIEDKRYENRFIEKTKSMNVSRLMRELVWARGKWLQESLTSWLDCFKPEVVFFCGGDSLFAYTITKFITERYAAKIIFYITDDFVTKRVSLSPFYWIRYLLIKKSITEMINGCCEFVTIGEKMSTEYHRRFGKKSIIAMNSVEIPQYAYKITSGIFKLVYTGGLHFKRWETLISLATAIEKIKAHGISAELEIYSSGIITAKIIKSLNRSSNCRFMGSLDKAGIKMKMEEADILVHVESFNRKCRHATRLSVSTKIPEYMAASRCILGIGPKEVASMEYLKEFAYVINDKDEEVIYNKLLMLLEDTELMEKNAIRAYETAKLNHDMKNIGKRIYDITVKCLRQG